MNLLDRYEKRQVMPQINIFREIEDYISTLDLKVEPKRSDFLVYDYEHANWEHYDRLSSYRQHYFEINLDITKGCDSFVDQFELPSITNRLTLISPHRLQTTGTHDEMENACKGFGILFKLDFMDANPANNNFLKDFPFFQQPESAGHLTNQRGGQPAGGHHPKN